MQSIVALIPATNLTADGCSPNDILFPTFCLCLIHPEASKRSIHRAAERIQNLPLFLSIFERFNGTKGLLPAAE